MYLRTTNIILTGCAGTWYVSCISEFWKVGRFDRETKKRKKKQGPVYE